ncbi:hypothetical protein AUP07_0393 [methanogenic archaeon mixed culture ISO4-G1]|nr:hypothetical protein AUP07_0393 [methanogenic archaeon mixed culture ISO4-G1]
MSLFETGPVVTTPGIRNMMGLGPQAIDTIQKCLDRHCQGDWGDLCDDDKQLNQDSLDEEKEKGFTYDSLFSSYETDFGKIYIITECDRSVTTILTPEEY